MPRTWRICKPCCGYRAMCHPRADSLPPQPPIPLEQLASSHWTSCSGGFQLCLPVPCSVNVTWLGNPVSWRVLRGDHCAMEDSPQNMFCFYWDNEEEPEPEPELHTGDESKPWGRHRGKNYCGDKLRTWENAVPTSYRAWATTAQVQKDHGRKWGLCAQLKPNRIMGGAEDYV